MRRDDRLPPRIYWIAAGFIAVEIGAYLLWAFVMLGEVS